MSAQTFRASVFSSAACTRTVVVYAGQIFGQGFSLAGFCADASVKERTGSVAVNDTLSLSLCEKRRKKEE